MPLNILAFLLNRTVAATQGVDDQRANVLGLTFSMMNVGLVPSVIITQAVARHEAESAAPPQVTNVPVTTGQVDTPPAVPTVEVPDVTKFNYDAAELHLKGAGFRVQRQDEISDSVKMGFVSRQLPSPHTPTTQGTAVKVFVSIGFPMPELIGKDLVTVNEAYGNTLKITTKPANKKTGTVSDQDVKMGNMVQHGDPIELTITETSGGTVS